MISVGVTTVGWLVVTFITKPTSQEKLRSFYQLVGPGGFGWERVIIDANRDNIVLKKSEKKFDLCMGILCMVIGCLAVYGALFATGYWIYANYLPAIILTIVTVVSTILLVAVWNKLDIK